MLLTASQSRQWIPSSLKPCWFNLWKEHTHNFRGFPGIATEMKNIVKMVRKLVAIDLDEGKQAVSLEELEELVRSSSSSESGEEEEEDDQPTWTLSFSELFDALKDACELYHCTV